MQVSQSGIPDVLDRLKRGGFVLADKIGPYLQSPLESYLKSLIPPPLEKRNEYFNILCRAMEGYLGKYNHPAAEHISSFLERCPLIQQADHSNLLLDQETFLNNLLHAEAARINGLNYIIASQCSIVSCLSARNPPKGPVFLNYKSRRYKLFDHSNRFLKDCSFCLLPSPVVFKICPQDGDGTLHDDLFLGRLNGKEFLSAETAFHYANELIWNSVPYANNFERIAFDESLVSELAIAHLGLDDSPLYKLIFDRKVRNVFIKIKRAFLSSDSSKAINLPYPDFFWIKKENKLRALVCDIDAEDSYFLYETGECAPIEISRDNLIAQLRAGNIYMDRMVAYLLRCLMPGVIAMGGTSQQDYLSEYQKIYTETHEEAPFLDDVSFKHVRDKSLGRFGGAPLIEGWRNIFDRNESSNIKAELEIHGKRKLIDTIGQFSCAEYLLGNS